MSSPAENPIQREEHPKQPAVSILVPTYNYARYLPEAIESALEQDWKDFELIVSDDASTDDSFAIIERYAALDRRVRAVRHPANLGMVKHWNWCLSAARGEYVKFLFGDDKFARRETVGRLLELLASTPAAVLAVSARAVIDENSQPTELWADLGPAGVLPGRKIIRRCIERDANLIGEPSATLFRRRDAARGFNPQYSQLTDLEMWFTLLRVGDLVYTPEPLCCFRRHPLQQTEINRVHRVGELEAARLLVDCAAAGSIEPGLFQRMAFERIYQLRKKPARGAEERRLEEILLAGMGEDTYRARWLIHKICRPFENLCRSIKRRLPPYRGRYGPSATAGGAPALKIPLPATPGRVAGSGPRRG